MRRFPLVRKLIQKFHPEAIPGIAAALYDIAGKTRYFRRYYEIMAGDISEFCSAEGSVLDIGTGPGRLLIELHKRRSGLRLTGIDLSAAMVSLANRNIAKAGLVHAIRVCEANAAHMPFPDDSFDLATSTGSIHHWKDPVLGLNEVFRVLKPGGHALMYDIVSDTPAQVKRQVIHEFGRLTAALLWIHAFAEPFYTCESFEALARSSAFEQGRIRFAGMMACLALTKKGQGILSNG